MGYCIDNKMVRVDFFNEAGMWSATRAVEWVDDLSISDPTEAFRKTLQKYFKSRISVLDSMTAICIHPYDSFDMPVMIKAGELYKTR